VSRFMITVAFHECSLHDSTWTECEHFDKM